MAILGDIAKVSTGQSAPQDPSAFTEDGHPFIRAGSLEKLLSGETEDSLEKIHPDKAEKYRLKLFPKDTVVFAKSGMSAKLGRVYRLKNPCYVVSHLATIIPSSDLDPGYLHRWFEANPPSLLINNDAYPSIKTSVICHINVPLPRLKEQKRIAAILDKADVIRQKRQQAIQLAEQFLSAVFLDMFGDPVTNPKGWEVKPLTDYAKVVTGYPFQSNKYVEYQPNKTVKLCRGANVLTGYLDWKDTKYVKTDYVEGLEEYLIKDDDILLAMDRPWISSGLKIIVFKTDDIPTYLVQRVARIRVLESVYQPYVYHSINSRYFERYCNPTETTVPHISPVELKKFHLLNPQKKLIEKYYNIVKSVRKSIDLEKEALNESNQIFSSISQRAFAGKL